MAGEPTLDMEPSDVETECPGREDRTHCWHWYDNDGTCCGCDDDTPNATRSDEKD